MNANRVLSKIDKTEKCWLWTGLKYKLGYGKVWDSSAHRSVGAHRAVYELLVGKIPDGLELDHLCRNPSCVRPEHLEPVTHAENMLRSGPYKQWTHCAKGHALTADNRAGRKPGRGRCKICKNADLVARKEALRQSGLCKCGRPLRQGFKNCPICTQYALDYYYKKAGTK